MANGLNIPRKSTWISVDCLKVKNSIRCDSFSRISDGYTILKYHSGHYEINYASHFANHDAFQYANHYECRYSRNYTVCDEY